MVQLFSLNFLSWDQTFETRLLIFYFQRHLKWYLLLLLFDYEFRNLKSMIPNFEKSRNKITIINL
jgi:hypothetical protein